MEFTQEQSDRHNALTREAWSILNPEMVIDGRPALSKPGFFARRRLRKAVSLFEEALLINPEGWQSMWAIGKALQRLGDHAESLKWFTRAHETNPTQADVAREAGLAALDCGSIPEAVRLCLSAVRLSPDDLGLQANLSLAYLLAGDDRRAAECAKVAVDGSPDDEISRAVHSFIHDVIGGRKKRPKRLSDAFPVR